MIVYLHREISGFFTLLHSCSHKEATYLTIVPVRTVVRCDWGGDCTDKRHHFEFEKTRATLIGESPLDTFDTLLLTQ
jgi:hypothetical protein